MQFPFQMSAPRMSLAKTKKESPQAKLCFLYNLHKEKKPGRGVRSERTYRAVGRSENPGGGALCVEMGFAWTYPRNQDATVKLVSELISIKF